jgi:hypothetical protein
MSVGRSHFKKNNDNTTISTSSVLFHRKNMTMLALTVQTVTATKMAGFVSHFIFGTEMNLFPLSRNIFLTKKS